MSTPGALFMSKGHHLQLVSLKWKKLQLFNVNFLNIIQLMEDFIHVQIQ